MIKNYAPGSDISLINTIYLAPKKDRDTGKWDKGSIDIIYKDNVTGEKKLQTIDNPPYTFYVAKDGHRETYNRLFIPESETEEITVPYGSVEKELAKLTGNENFYYDNIKSGNRYANKILHTHPDIFNSDTHIEDNYRYKFSKTYQNNICNISKSYFDIEADTIDMKGDFPELGECPINAITIILKEQNKAITLLLRNKANDQIAEFESYVKSGAVYGDLKSFIENAVGGWKQTKRFGIDTLDFNFAFYDEDEEIRLIQDLFIIINEYKPDFLLAWNMSFDIPYIIQRIINLGYNPEDIMCHKDFKHKCARYYVDERHKNEFTERTDFATISSYTVFLDQMIHFASRRKGQSAFTSFALDAIGEKVAKVKKLNYQHITTKIAELPYKDYKTFVFYNIMDVIVQVCIENKTGDLEYLFSKCNINSTRYSKCHRQTVYLVNRGCVEFEKNDNFIIGNNVNKGNIKTEKFSGAFVGDPTKLTDYAKKRIHGNVINILDNLIDFDYASLYPSILREFNMAPNTQIGMIEILHKVWEGENRSKNMDNYTRSGEFMENLHTHNWLLFCNRWLHLANFKEAYNDVIEYFSSINFLFGYRLYTLSGLIIPAMTNPTSIITPAEFSNELIKPAIFAPRPNMNSINEVIENAKNNKDHRYIFSR